MSRTASWLKSAIASSELLTAFREQFMSDALHRIVEETELPEPQEDHEKLARAVLYFESISALRRWEGLLAPTGGPMTTRVALHFLTVAIIERLWVAAASIETGVILTAATICSVPSSVLKDRGFLLPNIPECKECGHDMPLHRCSRKDAAGETRSCVFCECDVHIPTVENAPGVTTEVKTVQ